MKFSKCHVMITTVSLPVSEEYKLNKAKKLFFYSSDVKALEIHLNSEWTLFYIFYTQISL